MESYLHQLQSEIQDKHWWFRGRRHLIELFMSTEPALNGGCQEAIGEDANRFQDTRFGRVLEVGCGTGPNSSVLEKMGSKLIGVDPDTTALKRAAHEHKVKGDGTALPFGSDVFDLVLALDVLEHATDDVALAKELRRVTCREGKVLVFVPALPILWGIQDELSHHKRRYTKKRLVGVLEKAGLHISRISYFNTWLFLPILAVRLLCRYSGRSGSGVRSENEWTPAWLNGPLTAIFRSEAWVLRHMNFPVGVSLMALATPI